MECLLCYTLGMAALGTLLCYWAGRIVNTRPILRIIRTGRQKEPFLFPPDIWIGVTYCQNCHYTAEMGDSYPWHPCPDCGEKLLISRVGKYHSKGGVWELKLLEGSVHD